ncbi:MAG: helix-turn-helix domain-containing protein [Pseudomonadota bacterium]
MIAIFMAKMANQPARTRPLQVAVLAYAGCSAWVATSVREALELAVLLQDAGPPDLPRPLLQVRWLGTGNAPVAVSAAAHLAPPAPARPLRADVLVVPPLWHTSPDDFAERLGVLQAEVALIRKLARQGTQIASVCSGAALLAAAGVLDGRAATGCWWLEPQLRRLYPRVRWQLGNTLVRDGPVTTAGVGAAYARLVFELLERTAGRGLATRVAQFLGIEPNRGEQSAFASLLPPRLADDAVVAAFQRHVRDHVDSRELSIGALAAALGTSPRTLFRRVREATGRTPLRVIQLVRLEHAKALLADTGLSVEEICERCGWRDAASFRKLFAREAGMTASAWRKAFGLRHRR